MNLPAHAVKLNPEQCVGCTNCVKRCPTAAIRVRGGKAVIRSALCIDCGQCIAICPHHAKSAQMDRLEQMRRFRYKIALPAPALYGQFPVKQGLPPLLHGLYALGFDAVYEVASAAELVSRHTAQLAEQNLLPMPAISSACPVVVRLIRTRFPALLPNLLPILPPVEVAARLAKQAFCQEHGCPEQEVAAVFLSPCPAKATASRNPLGFSKSAVDLTLSIRELYPLLKQAIKQYSGTEPPPAFGWQGLNWGICGGEALAQPQLSSISADGMENILRVLSDLEDEKLPDTAFIELNACSGGCVGGILTVENPYLARSRIQQYRHTLPLRQTILHSLPDMLLERAISASEVLQLDSDLELAMQKLVQIDQTEQRLYGMDCGACGAPTCRAMATDIVLGYAEESQCIFRLKEEYAKSLHSEGRKLP